MDPRKALGVAIVAAACAACGGQPATDASPSPDLGDAVIAFHSDPDGRDDFYLVHADGTGLEQITDGAETIAFPYWSPDGERIAYLCCTGGSAALWVMDADGSDPVQLAAAPVGEPSWSPSGDEIAYASYSDEAIWVVGRDGASPRRVAEHAGGPAWSPDGTRLAFLSWRDFPGQKQRNEIYTANADGSDQRRLTHNEVDDIIPAWSPDGSRLAWISSADGVPHVHLMNTDGSDPLQLTDGADLDDAPTWAPDGSRIMYVSYLDGADPHMLGQGNADIFTVTPDGTAVNLTDDPRWDGYPAWSPDGAWIAYSINDGVEFNLFVMRADGSARRELPGVQSDSGTANDCCPAWQP